MKRLLAEAGGNAVVIDVGDNLFPELNPVTFHQEDLLSGKAAIVLEYLRRVEPHALGLGEQDLPFGEAAVEQLTGAKLPHVVGNVNHPAVNAQPWRVITTPSASVLYTNFIDPHLARSFSFGTAGKTRESVVDAINRLQDTVANGSVRAPDVWISSWHGESVEAAREATSNGPMPRVLLFGSHVFDRDEARILDDTLVVWTRSLGLSLQVLDLYLHPEGLSGWSDGRRYAALKRMSAAKHDLDSVLKEELVALASSNVFSIETLPLSADYPSDPHLTSMIEDLRGLPLSGNGAGGESLWFKGVSECAACHPAQTANWSQTPHEGAYSTLESKGAERSASCIQCHITGFGYPHGPQSFDETAPLRGVQCESCHVPTGKTHADGEGAFRPVSAATCILCHTRSQSPKFDFSEYLPRATCREPHIAPKRR